MPKYNYVALDARGNETKGSIEVGSQNEAIGRVKEMGLFPTKITEADKEDKSAGKKAKAKAAKPKAGGKKGGAMNINIKIPGFGGGVKPKVLTTFTRQLATLVDAGLPLLRGLRVLEKQERSGALERTFSANWPLPLKAAARSPRRWRSIRRFSTACSSTWSRPANWAACWKSS